MPTRKELQILTRIEAAEFGYQLAQEEFKPSQDELWEELEDNCMGYDEGSGGFLVINEAKKRYRITRKCPYIWKEGAGCSRVSGCEFPKCQEFTSESKEPKP